MTTYHNEIDGLMQKKRNAIANALELRLYFTNPWKYDHSSFLLFTKFQRMKNLGESKQSELILNSFCCMGQNMIIVSLIWEG